MPLGLERFYGAGDLHFITCSCHRRRKLLVLAESRDLFLHVLEEVREQYLFTIFGYVVMPEHFHLLISEPAVGDPSKVMLSLKQKVAVRSLPKLRKTETVEQFWQRRFYDFNVKTARKEREKLLYMHHNPVKRGLVERPDDWPWSSFRYYAFGEKGVVAINV